MIEQMGTDGQAGTNSQVSEKGSRPFFALHWDHVASQTREGRNAKLPKVVIMVGPNSQNIAACLRCRFLYQSRNQHTLRGRR
jgi:hypothetical protein